MYLLYIFGDVNVAIALQKCLVQSLISIINENDY